MAFCLLSSERRALSKLGLTAGRLAQNGGARTAGDDSLSVREHSGDVQAAGALDVHEERTGRSNELLELVLAELASRRGVEEILSQNLLLAFYSKFVVMNVRKISHRDYPQAGSEALMPVESCELLACGKSGLWR